MNGKLQKVADMIKKTFHTKDQTDCFEGSILYMEEHCSAVSGEYIKDIGDKFTTVKEILEVIRTDVKAIKEDLGLDGKH